MQNIENLNTVDRVGVKPKLSTSTTVRKKLTYFMAAVMAVLAGGCAKACDDTGVYKCLQNDDVAKATLKHVKKDSKDCKTSVDSVDTGNRATLESDRDHAQSTCLEATETVLKAKGFINKALSRAKSANDEDRIEACRKADSWITARNNDVEANHRELERK